MNEEFRRQNRQPGESLYDMPALRRVLMVGAIPELCGDLSELDQSLLTFGLDPLRIAGVPVVPPEEVEVEVMNKADLYGRRDFLTEEGIRADVVMLCNIPHMTDEQEYVQGLISRKSSFHASVQHLANHELSSHHWEPGIWQRKLAETGAKVIVSYGVDSMPLRMVMPEGYFHSQQLRLSPGSGQYIMSSNYVESLPFSQWGNPALNRFIVESQKHDIPYGLDDGDVDTGQHHD